MVVEDGDVESAGEFLAFSCLNGAEAAGGGEACRDAMLLALLSDGPVDVGPVDGLREGFVKARSDVALRPGCGGGESGSGDNFWFRINRDLSVDAAWRRAGCPQAAAVARSTRLWCLRHLVSFWMMKKRCE